MRRPLGVRTARPSAVLAAGALLAACAGPAPSPPQTGRTTTTAAPAVVATTAALAAAPSAGPLAVGVTVPIPVTADAVTAAEAPNGAVFVSPMNPGAGTTTVVWVVDGNGPAAVAEHVPSGVAALAADATNLYVASDTAVTAFDRSTGNRDGRWSLPAGATAGDAGTDLMSMAASGGRVLVMISRDNIEHVYRFAPDAPAAPRLVAQGTSAAFGPDGSIVYARSDNRLVDLSRTGVSTVGPHLADAPNGLGGGVQFVTAVADGLVWVSEPAGQGLDATMRTYDATTLARRGGYDGTETEQIVGTAVGPLDLVHPGGRGSCPQPTPGGSSSCVFRTTPGGTLSDGVPVGMAVTLLGPQPAVIANGPTSAAFELERLS